MTPLTLSRVSKLFLDRDSIDPVTALRRRQTQIVVLRIGADAATSRTMQLAILTAARLAVRCFPGAVRIAASAATLDSPLLVLPRGDQSFGSELLSLAGKTCLMNAEDAVGSVALVFGNGGAGLRVTFDGWLVRVGPTEQCGRLGEGQGCTLAGVLAGALAVSEIFLSFAQVTIEASRRVVERSLWQPNLPISDPSAQGPRVEYLPKDFWILGLGHLGNAFVWALATLPYAEPELVTAYLNDFDVLEPENHETSVIFEPSDRGLKSRAVSRWLESHGFATRLLERRFDSTFRCQPGEARLAFCGFDSNVARRALATADFDAVIEVGLGDDADNFDTLSIHTLPNPRSPDELWADITQERAAMRARDAELAGRSTAYASLAADECGRVLLAGKAVAVPFVGTVAATFCVAEALRLLHGGPAHDQLKLRLGSQSLVVPSKGRTYGAADIRGVSHCRYGEISDLLMPYPSRLR